MNQFRNYIISKDGLPFADLEPEEPTEKEEQEINKTVKETYGVPRTPQEADRMLNRISEDMVNQPVKATSKTGYALSRNPEFARLVKERDRYVCQICGVRGFEKRNGGLYAEAHHKKELAKNRIDNPHEMMCVCATCHRVIHYGTEKELKKRNAIRLTNSEPRILT
jgi:Predicted restriction endonuclease